MRPVCNSLLLPLLLLLLPSCESAEEGASHLRENLRKHVRTLASAEMEGRGAGTAGAMRAAQYIKSVYEEIGLTPINKSGYTYKFMGVRETVSGSETSLTLGGEDLRLGEDFAPLPGSGAGSFSGVLLDLREGHGGWRETEDPVALFRVEEGADWRKGVDMTARAGAKAVLIERTESLPPLAEGSFLTGEPLPIPVISVRREALPGSPDGEPVEGRVTVERETVSLRNVVGMAGREKEGKAILVGAHFDHLGARSGETYFGADDNASGVAVLLETARSVARGNPHEGPMVFVAFTGEEVGLLGSRAYVEDPPFPLDRTAAMVNLDMLGRLGDNDLLFAVRGLSDGDRSALKDSLRSRIGCAEMLSGYEAGDLAPFAEAQIPSLLLFTGPHGDYHRPTDMEEKIDYRGLVRVARFAAEAIPLFGRFAAAGFHGAVMPPAHGQAPRERPFLGTVPDFSASTGAGVVISEVLPASPAEKAGIRAGDTIMRFDGKDVSDLRAYADALGGASAGDRVSIILQRDGAEIAVDAVLERGRPRQ